MSSRPKLSLSLPSSPAPTVLKAQAFPRGLPPLTIPVSTPIINTSAGLTPLSPLTATPNPLVNSGSQGTATLTPTTYNTRQNSLPLASSPLPAVLPQYPVYPAPSQTTRSILKHRRRASWCATPTSSSSSCSSVSSCDGDGNVGERVRFMENPVVFCITPVAREERDLVYGERMGGREGRWMSASWGEE